MSVGNLKDSGNQGNNFPWQLKMLQGLQAIADNPCCAELIKLLDTYLAPQKRTVKVISTSTSGNTTTGIYSLSIANVGAAAGTVGGQSLPAGVTLNFDAGVLNNTLGALAYDATGTTFLISEMQGA